MKEYGYLIWIGIAAVVFVVLWRKGQLGRLSNYCLETRDELRKCTWPTFAELRGSTVVVMISTVLLGGFTMGVDFVLAMLVRLITQLKF